MSWRITDEWIDLGRKRHVVIFRDPDLGPDHPGHHLIHNFQLRTCPTCGTPHQTETGEPVDMDKLKIDTLLALQSNHKFAMQQTEKYRGVRIGTGPK